MRALFASRPAVTVNRIWDDEVHTQPITTDHGDFFLVPGRQIRMEADVTSEIVVRAHNGDVEVVLLEGAKSNPREVDRIVVKDGEERGMIHIWGGRWANVREVPKS